MRCEICLLRFFMLEGVLHHEDGFPRVPQLAKSGVAIPLRLLPCNSKLTLHGLYMLQKCNGNTTHPLGHEATIISLKNWRSTD